MGADPVTDEIVAEIARLALSIDRAAAATESALSRGVSAADGDAGAQRDELCRQLAALRDRVAAAKRRGEDPRSLRAELATLLSFATTLQADAETWRSARAAQVEALETPEDAGRDEAVAERENLARRRDALQSTIVQTAARMAQQYRGEWRRSIPVVTLGEGLTVCSVSVSCPRRGFRFAKRWLVTLTRSHDVLIRRE